MSSEPSGSAAICWRAACLVNSPALRARAACLRREILAWSAARTIARARRQKARAVRAGSGLRLPVDRADVSVGRAIAIVAVLRADAVSVLRDFSGDPVGFRKRCNQSHTSCVLPMLRVCPPTTIDCARRCAADHARSLITCRPSLPSNSLMRAPIPGDAQTSILFLELFQRTSRRSPNGLSVANGFSSENSALPANHRAIFQIASLSETQPGRQQPRACQKRRSRTNPLAPQSQSARRSGSCGRCVRDCPASRLRRCACRPASRGRSSCSRRFRHRRQFPQFPLAEISSSFPLPDAYPNPSAPITAPE